MPGTEMTPVEPPSPGEPEQGDFDDLGPNAVDPKLLEILVCPLTKQPLRYDRAASELVSEAARLAFPIRQGVPIMLIDEARRTDDDPEPKR